MFSKYANFTCKFTVADTVVVTQGRMEAMPLGARYYEHVLPDHVICPSPKMKVSGKGRL